MRYVQQTYETNEGVCPDMEVRDWQHCN